MTDVLAMFVGAVILSTIIGVGYYLYHVWDDLPNDDPDDWGL